MKKLFMYYFKKDLLQTSLICLSTFILFFMLSKIDLMLDSFFGFKGYLGLWLFITCITFISTKVEAFTKDFTTSRDFTLHIPVKRTQLASAHMLVILIFTLLTGPFILYAALYTFKASTVTGFFSILSLGWWGFMNMVNLVLMISTIIFVFTILRFVMVKKDSNPVRVNLLLMVSHLVFFLLIFFTIRNFMPVILNNPIMVFVITLLILTALVFTFLNYLKRKQSF